MNKLQHYGTRALIAMLVFTLGGIPELAQAQTAQQEQQPGIIDPSRGPLQPVPPASNQPAPQAPSTEQPLPNAPAPAEAQPAQNPRPVEQPAGTAAAEGTPTAGGLASKPAGNAFAPAKQRQTRSLLLKLGAIAGAGIALGTVIALTKGSPSKPPGAK